jgi:N-acetylglucosaminyldiphosphoundecaprenol N-acetyl-beta-D-mannosaminyltransferase
MFPRVQLLGVFLDPLTPAEAVARIRSFLEEDRQRQVVTPNSEMLVAGARDASFRAVLNGAALSLPDSAGLLPLARWTGQHLPARVTGVDTVQSLCADLDEAHTVFLLGAAPGVAEKAADALRRRNPRLRIAGTFAGSPKDADASAIIQRINAASPHLLFVAYGAPAQERWIHTHLAAMPSVRVAMGVGGTLDFLAGARTRAPSWMQSLSLEWLWRLLQEPSRLGRILNAVAVFPLLVLRYGKEAPQS